MKIAVQKNHFGGLNFDMYFYFRVVLNFSIFLLNFDENYDFLQKQNMIFNKNILFFDKLFDNLFR